MKKAIKIECGDLIKTFDNVGYVIKGERFGYGIIEFITIKWYKTDKEEKIFLPTLKNLIKSTNYTLFKVKK